jgi:hypothetical protein
VNLPSLYDAIREAVPVQFKNEKKFAREDRQASCAESVCADSLSCPCDKGRAADAANLPLLPIVPDVPVVRVDREHDAFNDPLTIDHYPLAIGQ